MWRINYLLQSFFTLMIHIVEDLHIFYNCVESTLPSFLRHDHYDGYDPDQDPYEIERRQIMQSIKEKWEREDYDLLQLEDLEFNDQQYFEWLKESYKQKQEHAVTQKFLKDHPELPWNDGSKFPWEE